MTVLVGVDGRPASRAAIRVAAQEAGYRSTPLLAIMAHSSEPVTGAPAAQPVATLRTGADTRLSAQTQLSDAVTEALGEQAKQVKQRVVAGLAGRALIQTARTERAELIVLAARGSVPLLLGTVSQHVLRNAPCPVLIVPPTASK